MKVKIRISDFILNLIISILILSMLTLTVLYAIENTTERDSDSKVFDNLWITQDSEDSAFSVFDISYCTPKLIAYKQPGNDPVATYFDSALTSTLYSVLSDAILDIFGSDSVCVSAEVDYPVAAKEVLESDSYILFEYNSDLPYPYIYALTSAQSSVDTSMCAQGLPVNISKIVLLLSQNENGKTIYSCYGFDSKYNAYKFMHSDNSPYNLQQADKIYIDAYADSLDTVSFLSESKSDNESLLSLEIIHGAFDYSPLVESSDIGMLKLDTEQSAATFLELFEINPEKINTYTDRDGSTVFIGTDERLSVSSGKIIEYTAENSPIPLKQILGYIPGQSNSFSLFDMLKATNIFISDIRSLYPELIGKSADIKLTGIYKTSEDEDDIAKPVFEYSYFYNGIKIDTDPAFRFVFDASGICKLNINISGFSPEGEKSVTLSKETVYKRLINTLDNVNITYPVYAVNDFGIYHIKWAAR